MFSHVTIGTNDVEQARHFYDATLAPLGLARHATYPESLGYGPAGGKPQLWVMRPLDRQTATIGNGITVGLDAGTRAAVDSAHATAMRLGGRDEGAPGLCPHYHANYYGAYLRDPDGNKLCIVCHHPA